jgi:hypothetical protein
MYYYKNTIKKKNPPYNITKKVKKNQGELLFYH